MEPNYKFIDTNTHIELPQQRKKKDVQLTKDNYAVGYIEHDPDVPRHYEEPICFIKQSK